MWNLTACGATHRICEIVWSVCPEPTSDRISCSRRVSNGFGPRPRGWSRGGEGLAARKDDEVPAQGDRERAEQVGGARELRQLHICPRQKRLRRDILRKPFRGQKHDCGHGPDAGKGRDVGDDVDRQSTRIEDDQVGNGKGRNLSWQCRPSSLLGQPCSRPPRGRGATNAGRRAATLSLRADVAELVDAHGSGPCGGNPVEVQVLSSA